METAGRKILLHLQKGERDEILLKKSTHSDWKKVMVLC